MEWDYSGTKGSNGQKKKAECGPMPNVMDARLNIGGVPAQKTAKHRAKFGWPPVSDVAALTKARREAR